MWPEGFNSLSDTSLLCKYIYIFIEYTIQSSMIVWFFFNSKWYMVWLWPEQNAEIGYDCNLLMVLLHDSIFDKYTEGLNQWKITVTLTGNKPMRNICEKHWKWTFCDHFCKDFDIFHEFFTFIAKLFLCAESRLCSESHKFWFVSDRTSLY